MTAGLFASVQPSYPVPGLRSVWFALFSVVVVVGAFCSQETWGSHPASVSYWPCDLGPDVIYLSSLL